MRRHRLLLLLATALAVVGLLGPASSAAAGPPVAVAGGTSGGDPYFPAAGNGGYQVRHYDLDLRYTPATKALNARARISATTKHRALRSFSLDLRGLAASAVRVDGRPARYLQQDGELIVTPRRVLKANQRFTVDVRYGGTTGQPEDNTGALYGWVSYADGAFVANEPEGASTWYPVNDSPYDKATYDFRITVPRGTTAVANGDFLGSRSRSGWTTFRWSAREPMASYLAMAASGNYRLTTHPAAGGLPIINAVDKDLSAADQADHRSQSRAAAADDRILLAAVRAVPVQLLRGRGGRRRGRRLRLGEPDPADLFRRAVRVHRRARARPPVVRRQRHAETVAGHLAQRGLRHLRRVAVERSSWAATGPAAVRRRVRSAGLGRLLAAEDWRPGSERAVQRCHLRPRAR